MENILNLVNGKSLLKQIRTNVSLKHEPCNKRTCCVQRGRQNQNFPHRIFKRLCSLCCLNAFLTPLRKVYWRQQPTAKPLRDPTNLYQANRFTLCCRVVFNYCISWHWGGLCVDICMAYRRINSLSTKWLFAPCNLHPDKKKSSSSSVSRIHSGGYMIGVSQRIIHHLHVRLRGTYLSNSDLFHPHR